MSALVTEQERRVAERDAWQRGLGAVHLSQVEVDGLLEYSTTLPTGKTIGKRWKRRLFAGPKAGAWLLCEYVEDPDPQFVGIRTREIHIIGARVDLTEAEQRVNHVAALRHELLAGTLENAELALGGHLPDSAVRDR